MRQRDFTEAMSTIETAMMHTTRGTQPHLSHARQSNVGSCSNSIGCAGVTGYSQRTRSNHTDAIAANSEASLSVWCRLMPVARCSHCACICFPFFPFWHSSIDSAHGAKPSKHATGTCYQRTSSKDDAIRYSKDRGFGLEVTTVSTHR